ncbi:uncharacterized protein EMPS_09995 [Entomortierella parvispora]|uniref:FAD-binding FR-type domain-containing protein n=1 Tax=Entomortierella parvispora TaxID=205924 RepID=A0A9P3M0K4_9FUNG|nr:uncharacterized protein EMPS_09995 [Entomortierella parvispora]
MPVRVQESTVSLRDRWHSGERWVQDQIHVREEVEGASAIFRPYLTTQMQEFVPSLEYMFLGTLDSRGRPWVSILTGPKGFMKSTHGKILEVVVKGNKDEEPEEVSDPLYSNLLNGESFGHGEKTMWSGVALDFSNRRRNKMNGVLYKDDLLVNDEKTGELHVMLTVEQTIGNCPKYVTIRELSYQTQESSRSGSARFDLDDDHGLTELHQTIIRQADCVFISSRHIDESLPDLTSGMDCNHRGGNPGFIHLDGRTILFPDYSGNRFFNTLGNIAEDERVGLLFLSFETGDTLQFTGRAKIIFGQESQTLYPHAQRLVQVELDSVVFRKAAVPFRMHTKELSPYNPRVPGHRLPADAPGAGESTMAQLTNIIRHSPDIATFHFQTSRPIHYQPGQYAVLDFSQLNTTGYRHMAPENPRSLNDDYIRTWTISSAPDPATKTDAAVAWKDSSNFTMTIKRKAGGLLTSILHSIRSASQVHLTVPLVCTGGEFILPSGTDKSALQKVAFISGGIGSTPFISMIRGLRQVAKLSSPLSIHWIMSVSQTLESLPSILKELCGSSGQDNASSEGLDLKVSVFLTRESPGEGRHASLLDLNGVQVFFKRLDDQSVAEVVPDLTERKVLICGPDSFMDAVRAMCDKMGVSPESVLTEAFNF